MMNEETLAALLEKVKEGEVSVEEAVSQMKTLPFTDLGYAKIDNHRAIRSGSPEVIYCEGKSLEHIRGIVRHMLDYKEENIMATRAGRDVFEAIRDVTDEAVYYDKARIAVIKRKEIQKMLSRKEYF